MHHFLINFDMLAPQDTEVLPELPESCAHQTFSNSGTGTGRHVAVQVDRFYVVLLSTDLQFHHMLRQELFY